MTSLPALLTLLFLIACTPTPEVTDGAASGKAINEEAPYIWVNKNFPKTIRISSSFDATETNIMTEMGTAWKTAVTDQVTFFTNGAVGNNNYNLNNTDNVFGVYKATTWPADVSDDALAITQLFGRRYNLGEVNEYVGIVEADILVNYQPGINAFDFDVLDNGIDEGFDLRTIILHEMGHFLGLQHIPSYSNRPDADLGLTYSNYKLSSVMFPSISSLEEKRIPQTKDINALVNKYNIGGGGGAMVASNSNYQPNNDDPGKNIKIVIELKKSGECIHKEDGVVVRRHPASFK